MADKDEAPAGEEQAQDDAPEQTPDEIIEQEAEAELDAARGGDGGEEDGEDDGSDEDEAADDDEASDDGAEESEDGEDDGDEDSEDVEDDDDSDDDDEDDEDEDDEEDDEEEPSDVPQINEKTSDEDREKLLTEHGVDAVGKDYKPKDWASFLKDSVNAVRGEVNKDRKVAEQTQAEYDNQIKQVNDDWQGEIDELTKSGDIPKKGEARDKAVEETFAWMAQHNKKNENNPNKQIWSFEVAHNLRQGKQVSKERQEEIKKRRNARGGKVSGSGSNDGGGSGSGVSKGMSLDDIIDQEFEDE